MQNGPTLPPVTPQPSRALSFLTAKPGSNLAWYVKDATQGNWLLSRLAIVPATVLDGLDLLGDLIAGTWNAGVHLSRREYKLAANDATGAFWACLTRVAIASNNVFTIIDSGTRALEAYTNEMKPAHARQAGSQSVHLDFQAALARITKDNELEGELKKWLTYVPEDKLCELDSCIGNDIKLQKAIQLVLESIKSLKAASCVSQNIDEVITMIDELGTNLRNTIMEIIAYEPKFAESISVQLGLTFDSLKRIPLQSNSHQNNEITEIVKQLSSLREQLSELSDQNKQLTIINEKAAELAKENQQQIFRLQQGAQDLEEERNMYQQKNSEYREELAQLKDELTRLKAENEDLKISAAEQEESNTFSIIASDESSDSSDDLSDSSEKNFLNDSQTSDLNEAQNSILDDSQSTDQNLSSYSDYYPTPEQPKGESRLNNDNIISEEFSESKDEKVEEADEIKNEKEEVAPEQALRNLFDQLKPSIKAMDQGKYLISRKQNQTISELLDSNNQLLTFYTEWKSFGFGPKKGKYTEKTLTPKQHKRLANLLP